MRRKKILTSLLAIILVIGISIYLVGSKKTEQITTKSPKITLAMVTFPGYAPLYLAKEKGFFSGIDVELVRIESIGDIRAAMRSGNVNMFAATYDIYQSVKDVAPNGIGFLVVDESHGADGIAVEKNITSIQDLRGKKVGAEPGFPPYMILQYLLNKEGMTLNDLNFQDIPTTDAGSAFAAGSLVAAGIWEPTLTNSIKARSGAKVFASSADVPGLIQDLIFADEKLAKEHPEVLEKFSAGYFRALEYIDTNHDDAYQIMAKAYNVSVEEMEDFKTGVSWIDRLENMKLFDKTNEINVYKTYDLVCSILEKNGDTNVCLKAEEKLTDEIIKKFK